MGHRKTDKNLMTPVLYANIQQVYLRDTNAIFWHIEAQTMAM